MKISDSIAVVTGSSRGIGKAIAWKLCEKGATVYINSFKSREEGELLQKELQSRGFNSYYINADVSSKVAVEKMFDIIRERHGKLDILVNNAGFYSCEDDYSSYKSFHKFNGWSVYLCTRAAEELMRGGKIINISSIYGVEPNPKSILASGVKAEVESYTKAFAKKFKGRIEVNSVAPGYTDTKLVKDNISEEQLREALESNSRKQLIRPEEIADAVIFLVESDSITGQTLVVDNGHIV